MESYVRKEEAKVISDSDIIEVRYDYDPPCGMIENRIKIQLFWAEFYQIIMLIWWDSYM